MTFLNSKRGSGDLIDDAIFDDPDTYSYMGQVSQMTLGCESIESTFSPVTGFCQVLPEGLPVPNIPGIDVQQADIKRFRLFCLPVKLETRVGPVEAKQMVIQLFTANNCDNAEKKIEFDLGTLTETELRSSNDFVLTENNSTVKVVLQERLFSRCENPTIAPTSSGAPAKGRRNAQDFPWSYRFQCSEFLVTRQPEGQPAVTVKEQYPILRIAETKRGFTGVEDCFEGESQSKFDNQSLAQELRIPSTSFAFVEANNPIELPDTKCTTFKTQQGTTVSVIGSCDKSSRTNRPNRVRIYNGAGCSQTSDEFIDVTEETMPGLSQCSGLTSAFGVDIGLRFSCEYKVDSFDTLAPSSSPTFAPTTPLEPPSNNNTNGNTGGNETEVPPPDLRPSPESSTAGVWVAVVPVVVIFAFIMYLCVTRKRDGNEDENEDLEGRLPPHYRGKKVGQMNLGVYSVSLHKVKGASTKRSEADSHPASSQEFEEDDDRFHDLEESKSSGGSKTSSNSGASSSTFTLDVQEIKLGSLIGKGAHGKVYEGTFRGSPVAVKEFIGGRSKNSFLREYRNLQKLKHPNVVRLFGIVEQDAKPHGPRRMLVMERAETSIAAFLASKRTHQPPFQNGATISTLLQWSQQICSGCSFIHSKNLIHFDIKPENLLLDGAGNVKICDLGISRTIQSAGRTPSNENQEGGTPSYTAPELFTESRDQITKAVDVYSFAIVFWQLFHDGPPHPKTWNLIHLITQVTEQHYRPPIDVSLPIQLSSLIEACWEEDPHARPSFEQLVKELDHLLGPRSVNVSAKLAGRPPFEKGQKVYVWDHLKMRFVSPHAALVKENMRSDGTYAVEQEDGDGRVAPGDLLLCTDLLKDY